LICINFTLAYPRINTSVPDFELNREVLGFFRRAAKFLLKGKNRFQTVGKIAATTRQVVDKMLLVWQ